MGPIARIKAIFMRGNPRNRSTNRGVAFTLEGLGFVDETGEIIGCDYGYAAVLLNKSFAGGVLPKELVSLLTDYCNNPCLETALDLILFDPKFLVAYFADNKKTRKFQASFDAPSVISVNT